MRQPIGRAASVLGVIAVLVIAAQACGPTQTLTQTDGGEDASTPGSPPELTTTELEPAVVGRFYAQQLQVRGGVAPYRWAMDAGADLAWVRLDETSGLLSGTPSLSVDGGVIEIGVVDSQPLIARKVFTLSVLACVDGASASTQVSQGAACMTQTERCEGGVWVQSSLVASTSRDQCGASCDQCVGVGVNTCGNGGQDCMCGSSPACVGATCCGIGAESACSDLTGDTKNCGQCGHDCSADAGMNLVPTCSSAVCHLVCDPGYRDCNGDGGIEAIDRDGCETHVTADVDNCGACGNACGTRQNAQSSCAAGGCGYACDPGYRNCDPGDGGSSQGDDGNGCETHIAQDLNNCGACGNACGTRPNSQPGCNTGACTFTCDSTFRNCNSDGGEAQGSDSDGCETLITTIYNCGACGNACVGHPNAPASCNSGTCSSTCLPGYLNCSGGGAGSTNGADGNGCETHIAGDPSNCGSCGHVCQAPVGGGTSCSSFACVPSCGGATPNRCGGTPTEGGYCTNLSTDHDNCGSCGHVCPNATDRCTAGDCNYLCDDQVTYCKSSETCLENPPTVWKCSGGA